MRLSLPKSFSNDDRGPQRSACSAFSVPLPRVVRPQLFRHQDLGNDKSEAKDLRHPVRGPFTGTTKILRLPAQDDPATAFAARTPGRYDTAPASGCSEGSPP